MFFTTKSFVVAEKPRDAPCATRECGCGDAFGHVCLCLFVCLFCSRSNFWKLRSRNFIAFQTEMAAYGSDCIFVSKNDFSVSTGVQSQAMGVSEW